MEERILAMAEFIKLSPALPWIAEQGHAGLVTACAPDRLILESPLKSFSTRLTHITVSLQNDQNFHFKGRLETEVYPFHFIISPEERQTLQELLGQIRKDQHIEICRSQDVEAEGRYTGFQELSFLPEALPLFDHSEIDTSVDFLGQRFALPILITGMTGGIQKGMEINRRLALAAQKFGIPMGVGSQRIALDNAEYAPIFSVKDTAPNVFLIGNIGIAQLADKDALDRCRRAVDMIDANALAIHFNVVQEHIQVEGDRNLAGIMKNLEMICKTLNVPVIAKEVGSGISPSSAKMLAECGIAAIDIGGAGGTSWAHIEGLRSSSDIVSQLGLTFRNWGIPTAYSLVAVREALKDFPLIATGGIRDGLTAAKACALGAQFAGIGLPLLKAALQNEEAVEQAIEGFERGLRLTMLASGAKTLADLKSKIVRGRPYQSTFERLIPSHH
ncbi:MAG: type 2 isopentenyl-diphosphate Delta-isomerase [Proteobacteria bacterium]|nr:MAG: type 2 isopentenyl-diphosphate Delta-isomerase [Pseudomonadota bacterium]